MTDEAKEVYKTIETLHLEILIPKAVTFRDINPNTEIEYDDALDESIMKFVVYRINGSGKDESILKFVVYRIAQTELRKAIGEEYFDLYGIIFKTM